MEIIVRKYTLDKPTQYDDSFHQLNDIGAALPADLEEFRRDINEIVFLTGNKNKLDELRGNLRLGERIKLSCPKVKIDLPEIQDSNALNIVQDKCQRASERIIRDKDATGACAETFVLVEDTCLNFRALGGMPGPYVKWFLEAVGPEGLSRMLAGFPDKSAEAVCIYALMGPPPQTGTGTILFFRGVARGRIVEPRRASPTSGWGWDPVFEEERSRLTFAEMGQDMKSKFSHRASALAILRKFLEHQTKTTTTRAQTTRTEPSCRAGN